MTTADRIKHAAAIALIGDGVIAAVRPAHDAQFWNKGPASWQRCMRWFQFHPHATRIFGIAQASLALIWVLHHERGVKSLLG